MGGRVGEQLVAAAQDVAVGVFDQAVAGATEREEIEVEGGRRIPGGVQLPRRPGGAELPVVAQRALELGHLDRHGHLAVGGELDAGGCRVTTWEGDVTRRVANGLECLGAARGATTERRRGRDLGGSPLRGERGLVDVVVCARAPSWCCPHVAPRRRSRLARSERECQPGGRQPRDDNPSPYLSAQHGLAT